MTRGLTHLVGSAKQRFTRPEADDDIRSVTGPLPLSPEGRARLNAPDGPRLRFDESDLLPIK